MKTKELRSKSAKELNEQLRKEQPALAAFRSQSAKGKSKNVKSARNSRRTIARILTILKESNYGTKT